MGGLIGGGQPLGPLTGHEGPPGTTEQVTCLLVMICQVEGEVLGPGGRLQNICHLAMELDALRRGHIVSRVEIEDLPYVQVGPFHTNTRAALQSARSLLRRRKHSNKQVILITDGKPTVITDEEGVVYRNTFGLDPRIVNKTLDEAIALRREGIPITTFMIASDRYLQQFVHRLTELNRGKAYFSEPGQLGEFVLVDFVRNRRGRLR